MNSRKNAIVIVSHRLEVVIGFDTVVMMGRDNVAESGTSWGAR